jgi:hypothetical protein
VEYSLVPFLCFVFSWQKKLVLGDLLENRFSDKHGLSQSACSFAGRALGLEWCVQVSAIFFLREMMRWFSIVLSSCLKGSHEARILSQFTQQAAPFAAAAPIRQRKVIDDIITAANPSAHHRALDVACGPGLLACAMAKHVVSWWLVCSE